jgi:hydroxyethylthiazole kinase
MRAPDELPFIAANVLARLRDERPRVHCITNAVAQAYTANALLAVGAVPSMTVAVDEIGEFVASADALLVNLGTMDPERHEAVGIAIEEARESGRPFVLDPVFVERSAPRAAFARGLMASAPAVVRMNAAEFAVLAGAAPSADTCRAFAARWSTVVALTGRDDVVADGARRALLSNGDPLMGKVTAMGCAASAIVAACLAVEDDSWVAAIAGLTVVGIAGEMAAARAAGPGSLSIGFIDALAAIDADHIVARARTRAA